MKTKFFSITLFFLLVLGIKSFAQSDTVFYDNFSNNKNNWLLDKNDTYEAKIENNIYNISVKKTDAGWYFLNNVFFDFNMDFEIETKVKQTSGESAASFGLLWFSDKSLTDFNSLIIGSDKKYKVTQRENGNITNLIKPTESSDIKNINESNILKIEKRGKSTNFYINNKLVNTLENIKAYGLNFGFILLKQITLEVEYFIIKQKNCPKLNLVENAINGYKKENLGANINSEFVELCPVISADGNSLYVCRSNHPNNIKDKNDQDIWYSTKNSKGEWNPIKNIGSSLNNISKNWVISVSPDGNTLLVNGKYSEDGKKVVGDGLSLTNRTDTSWEVPKPIEISDYYNKNSFVSYCLSSDKQILMMSIQRDDSYGDLDIYVSFKEGDKFSTPKNLGSKINSFGTDGTPYLASDNTTLYYSSDGKPGFGKADIFVTRRLDDTWQNWSEPQNLGPEINTEDWDGYFTVQASGDYAYLVSYSNSLGGSDVFRIALSQKAKPKPIMMISGKVLNTKTKQSVPAEITYYDLETNKVVGTALANPKDGSYKIALPSGKKYSFMAKYTGYYAIRQNIDLSTIEKYTEIEKNLLLVPIEVGEIIKLNNVFFDYNKSDLKSESHAEIDRLWDLLNKNTNMKIEIAGHTDSDGLDANNIKLSLDRTKSVEKYLLDKGITKDRIVSKGYGKSKPIATNDTDEGKAQNRRVEFKILSK